MCSEVIPYFPDDPIKALPDLLEKIKTARAAKALKLSDPEEEKDLSKVKGERWMEKERLKERAGLSTMKKQNQFLSMISSLDPNSSKFKADPRIPALHKELADAKILP